MDAQSASAHETQVKLTSRMLHGACGAEKVRENIAPKTMISQFRLKVPHRDPHRVERLLNLDQAHLGRPWSFGDPCGGCFIRSVGMRQGMSHGRSAIP